MGTGILVKAQKRTEYHLRFDIYSINYHEQTKIGRGHCFQIKYVESIIRIVFVFVFLQATQVITYCHIYVSTRKKRTKDLWTSHFLFGNVNHLGMTKAVFLLAHLLEFCGRLLKKVLCII